MEPPCDRTPPTCTPHSPRSADPARLLREALAAYGLSRHQLRRLASLAPNALHWALRSPDPAPELRALLAIQTAMLTPLRREPIRMPADIAGLLIARLDHCDQEQLHTVCLDAQNCVQDIARVYQGSVHRAVVRTAEVFKRAIQLNSCAIILAHNHPASTMAPSEEDLNLTSCCIQLGRQLDIEVLDHLIIGAGQWLSVHSWLAEQSARRRAAAGDADAPRDAGTA